MACFTLGYPCKAMSLQTNSSKLQNIILSAHLDLKCCKSLITHRYNSYERTVNQSTSSGKSQVNYMLGKKHMKWWLRMRNNEQHAQLTRPPPVNDIVGEFKNQARFELGYAAL